ncbi:hypothetical protein [Arthrobacter antibioticus]|uniref:hypothetical protein n=1 Tax=Arthrobacter sp. H35-MC1 TaxID=3046203 RepID=UPI0024BB2A81|nr:hypothetical protein [Arthrobacter sp. H35-MC1]MDJ0315982.1 hypothetical protein [Arthrobacter sp. H35-MC1]
MSELPVAYAEYLKGRSSDFIATVLPVLLQSVAEKTHGVHVVLNSHVIQAQTDPEIPFGEIFESVD